MKNNLKKIIIFLSLILILFQTNVLAQNTLVENGSDIDNTNTINTENNNDNNGIVNLEDDSNENLSNINIFDIYDNLNSTNGVIPIEYENELYEFLSKSPLYSMSTMAVENDVSGSCGTDTSFYFDNTTGVLTISGTGIINGFLKDNEMKEFYETVLEIKIEEGVKQISDNAFNGFSATKKVTIPESIELIEGNAFRRCTNLEIVNYNAIKAVCTAEDNGTIYTVFLNDFNIKELNIGENVEVIPRYLFWTSSNTDNVFNITELKLPNSLKKIEDCAFSNFRTITSITIPSNVEYIGNSAFSGCTSLTSVTINSSIANIFDTNNTFYRTNVNFYTHDNSPAYYWVNTYASGQNNSLCVKNNEWVTVREPSFNRKGLNVKICTICRTTMEEQYIETEMATYSVIIPKTLILDGNTGIANYKVKVKGYISNEDLVYVRPENEFEMIDEIGRTKIANIKQEKTQFSSVEINLDNWTTTNGFVDCDLIAGNWHGSLNFDVKIGNLDDTVDITELNFSYIENDNTMMITKYLGDDANIKIAPTYTIDNVTYNVVGINSYAFANNTNVKSISIPDSVTYIGNSCFRDCISLTNIDLPSNLSYMGESLFRNCTSLKTINELPNYDELPNFSFYGCTSLENVVLNQNMTKIGQYAFYNCSSLKKIPDNGNLKSIGTYGFAYCSSLDNINIPNGITTLGNHTFRQCINAKNISIPTSLTKIPAYCFYYCSSIESLIVPNHINRIGYEAFRYMTSLKQVEWYPTNPKVSSYDSSTSSYLSLFYKAPIETIVIGNNVELIPNGVFADFAHTFTIKNIVIPSSVKTIAEYAFSGIYSLENIDFSNATSLIDIYNYAFRDDINLKNLSLPENLEKIGSSAFDSCSSLENITFNEKLYSIDTYAFRKNTSLKEVILPESLTHLYGHAFRECTSMTYLYMPENLTYIGASAFYGTTALDVLDYACIDLTTAGYTSSTGGLYINMFGGAPLTTINFFEGVKNIPSCLFYNNSTHVDSAKTTTIVLPSTLNMLGYNNFYNWNELRTVVIKAHGGTYYAAAFGNVKTLITDVYSDLNSNWKNNWGLTNATWHPLSEYVDPNEISTFSLFAFRPILEEETVSENDILEETVSDNNIIIEETVSDNDINIEDLEENEEENVDNATETDTNETLTNNDNENIKDNNNEIINEEINEKTKEEENNKNDINNQINNDVIVDEISKEQVKTEIDKVKETNNNEVNNNIENNENTENVDINNQTTNNIIDNENIIDEGN